MERLWQGWIRSFPGWVRSLPAQSRSGVSPNANARDTPPGRLGITRETFVDLKAQGHQRPGPTMPSHVKGRQGGDVVITR